jgi:hypothetical protein
MQEGSPANIGDPNMAMGQLPCFIVEIIRDFNRRYTDRSTIPLVDIPPGPRYF